MGCVYRARHVRLGREAAIKVLNPEYVARPDVVERFFREARFVNEIDHEHIVEITDFVEAPGLAYLVMELLDGESLRQLMERRGRRYPPIARLLPIMRQVCAALDAAHAKGIVHRDLKPDNVFVIERGGEDFAKVLDFGVARLLDQVDQAATTTGMIIGTPHYMSPEQALGRPVGRDADVWAAGVVLHELLAGGVPFSAPSFVELAVAIRGKPPRPLPKRTPRRERIPPWLVAVVTRCLEKKPEDRYRTMAALAAALEGPRKPPQVARTVVLASIAVAAAAGVAAAVTLGVPRSVRQAGAAAASTAQSVVSRLSANSSRPVPAPPTAPTEPDPRRRGWPGAERRSGGAGANSKGPGPGPDPANGSVRARAVHRPPLRAFEAAPTPDRRAARSLDPARRDGGAARHRAAAREDAARRRRPAQGGDRLDRAPAGRVHAGEVRGGAPRGRGRERDAPPGAEADVEAARPVAARLTIRPGSATDGQLTCAGVTKTRTGFSPASDPAQSATSSPPAPSARMRSPAGASR